MDANGWAWIATAGDDVAYWEEEARIQAWIDAGAPPVEPPSPMPGKVEAVEVPAVALAVNREQAATLLSVSVDHFKRHVLPHLRVVQVGRRQLVPVRELEEFMATRAARALRKN